MIKVCVVLSIPSFLVGIYGFACFAYFRWNCTLRLCLPPYSPYSPLLTSVCLLWLWMSQEGLGKGCTLLNMPSLLSHAQNFAIKTECIFLVLLFAKCVDVCNLCLPRLWVYTLLQLTGPESRFLLASTPLLQPVLVSLIPDGRVSDKCTLSKGEESSLGFEKMYVGLTRGKVLPTPPP